MHGDLLVKESGGGGVWRIISYEVNKFFFKEMFYLLIFTSFKCNQVTALKVFVLCNLVFSMK